MSADFPALRRHPMGLAGQAAPDRIFWCSTREIIVHGFDKLIYHRSWHNRVRYWATPYYSARTELLLRRWLPSQCLEVGLVFGLRPNKCPSLGIETPEDGHMYGVGSESTLDGRVEEEMHDVAKETKGGKLTIKYPFSPYMCSACWEIMESPQKLVEHMGAKHKDDFLQFACSLCNKSNRRLKGTAIHWLVL